MPFLNDDDDETPPQFIVFLCVNVKLVIGWLH